MRKLWKPRRGESVSEAGLVSLIDRVESSRIGHRSGVMRVGDQQSIGADSHVVPVLAVIDDATARPLGAGVAYNVALIDQAGVAITGSAFPAKEVSGDQSVPDGQPIQVFPVNGEWGFLWHRRVLVIGGAGQSSMIDENAAAVAQGSSTWGISLTEVASIEKAVMLHSTQLLGTNGISLAALDRGFFTVATTMIGLAGLFPGGAGGNVDYYIDLVPVTQDWTPATVTWNIAGGLSTGTPSSVKMKNFTAGAGGNFSDANLEWTPTLRNGDIAGAWATITDCYGFRIEFSGCAVPPLQTHAQTWTAPGAGSLTLLWP